MLLEILKGGLDCVNFRTKLTTHRVGGNPSNRYSGFEVPDNATKKDIIDAFHKHKIEMETDCLRRGVILDEYVVTGTDSVFI